MAVLENLEPRRVFHFFEELCGIPHGSFHTEEISAYCVSFAKERKLAVAQDAVGNVIIRKPGAKGGEHAKPIILQAHLDMVCEKTEDSDHDFEKDGIKLLLRDGFVAAEDTTLGGDDGIGAAMILAILDSDKISHPPIEAVLTTDEEVGMGGAKALDMSCLAGAMLINLDSEEEGILTVGCAGGFRFDAHIPLAREETGGIRLALTVSGLLGGHSGMEIHRQRGNAHVLMGRILSRLREKVSFRLAELSGGKADNVIAAESRAALYVAAWGHLRPPVNCARDGLRPSVL